MPIFSIHFRHGDRIAKDDEGIELPSLAEALETALLSAREIVADERQNKCQKTLTSCHNRRRKGSGATDDPREGMSCRQGGLSCNLPRALGSQLRLPGF